MDTAVVSVALHAMETAVVSVHAEHRARTLPNGVQPASNTGHCSCYESLNKKNEALT